MKFTTMLALVVLLCGCAGKPGGNWLGVNTPQDVGTLPSNYQEMVSQLLRSQLKDPYSAVIKFANPYVSSCSIGVYGPHHGWAVPVVYNAKNSFGAYTGERALFFWISNGRVSRISTSPTSCSTRSAL